ncbi:hypothetical protein OQA88_8902 [Cercophora sp. LCS_1]
MASLILALLLTSSLASPTPFLYPIPQPPSAPQPPQPRQTCTKSIPNLWSITDFVAHLTDDETVAKGNATFTLVNTQTGNKEELKCNLRFNYLCEWLPTPGDKETNVWLAMNEGRAAVTVNQGWSCGETKSRVTGVVEVPVKCEGGECKGIGSGDGEVLDGGELRRRVVKGGGLKLVGVEGTKVRGRAVVEKEKVDGKVAVNADGDWARKGGLVLKGLERRAKVEEPSSKKLQKRAVVPPYPMPKAHEVKEQDANGFLGMARKGRAMAQAWGHHKGKNPWVEVFQGRGGNGGRVMESKGGQVKKVDDKKEHKEEKPREDERGKDEKKKDDPVSEKKLIEQMEHRLCSPSCLREAIPEPDSGHQYSDGRRKPHH